MINATNSVNTQAETLASSASMSIGNADTASKALQAETSAFKDERLEPKKVVAETDKVLDTRLISINVSLNNTCSAFERRLTAAVNTVERQYKKRVDDADAELKRQIISLNTTVKGLVTNLTGATATAHHNNIPDLVSSR